MHRHANTARLSEVRDWGTYVRGHAGELLHMSKAYNYSLDDAALQLRGDAELENWLFGHLKAYIRDGVDRPLFAEWNR